MKHSAHLSEDARSVFQLVNSIPSALDTPTCREKDTFFRCLRSQDRVCERRRERHKDKILPHKILGTVSPHAQSPQPIFPGSANTRDRIKQSPTLVGKRSERDRNKSNTPASVCVTHPCGRESGRRKRCKSRYNFNSSHLQRSVSGVGKKVLQIFLMTEKGGETNESAEPRLLCARVCA